MMTVPLISFGRLTMGYMESLGFVLGFGYRSRCVGYLDGIGNGFGYSVYFMWFTHHLLGPYRSTRVSGHLNRDECGKVFWWKH